MTKLFADVQLEEKDLIEIAATIGNGWELMVGLLGVPNVEVQRIKMDNRGDTVAQIYQALLKWKRQQAAKATLDVLCRVIENNTAISVDLDKLEDVKSHIGTCMAIYREHKTTQVTKKH